MKWLRTVLSSACLLAFGAVIFTAGTHPWSSEPGTTPDIQTQGSMPTWQTTDEDAENVARYNKYL